MKNKKYAILFVIIVPLLLFSRELLNGQAMFWGLPEMQFYPWRALAFEQISQGILPLWNPYNGLGTPLLANYQSALLYPFTWLICIFYLVGKLPGMVFGHTVINILHLIIAGLGMVHLCGEKKISWTGAAIAGISYSLSGYFLARFGFYSMIWTAAWFPWIFLYTVRIYQSEKIDKNFIKLSIIIAMMLLAGHAQLSWYSILYCALWGVAQIKKPYKQWFRQSLHFICAGVLALIISAAQLIPTADLLVHSQRSHDVAYQTAMTYSFWPWHFLNFINPHFFGHPATGTYWGYAAYWEDAVYMGLLPLFLVLGSIVLLIKCKDRKTMLYREEIFLWGISVLAIVLALGNNLPVFPWLYRYIPSFDMFNAPARFMIWVIFSFSLLAGYTFDRWRKPQKKVLYWVRLGTASGFGIAIGAGLMLIAGPSVKPTLIQAAFELSILLFLCGLCYLLNPITTEIDEESKKGTLWRTGAFILVAADLILMNAGKLPMQSSADIQAIIRPVEDKTIYLPEGDDYALRYDQVLIFQDYQETLSIQSLALYGLADMNLFTHTSSLNNFEPMRLASYDEFISALNQLNPEQRAELLPRYGINTLLALKDGQIVEQPLSDATKVYSTSGATTAVSMDAYIDQAFESDCVYLMTDNPMENESRTCVKTNIQPINFKQNGTTTAFQYTAPDDGWLVINQTYDHGWHATVDGIKTSLMPANGFVSALPITKGTHDISLHYLPNTFIIGVCFSLVGLLLTGILYNRINKNFANLGASHDNS